MVSETCCITSSKATSLARLSVLQIWPIICHCKVRNNGVLSMIVIVAITESKTPAQLLLVLIGLGR